MDSHIQSYLRFAASSQRDIEQIGPFLATFSRSSANPFLNYAIPDNSAAPSEADVAALISAYEGRGLAPRLEYVARLAPLVEPVLTAAGFIVEGYFPVMVCTPGAEKALPLPENIELVVPTSDSELLDTVTVQHEAYGESAPSCEDVDRLRESLTMGSIAVLARDATTGEPAGAGQLTVPGEMTTEIAGIGVRPSFRRRGIAGALTARLLREAFAAGVSVAFLTPGHDEEARIYSRAGFVPVGEILHISRSTVEVRL
ncbi:GNAT family N-acetyltransferase [Microcoleus sp. herbarium14]